MFDTLARSAAVAPQPSTVDPEPTEPTPTASDASAVDALALVELVRAAPDPSAVDDAELIELIRTWERLASQAAAGQLAAIAELARRRPRDLLDRPPGPTGPLSAGGPAAAADAGHPSLPQVSEFAVDEVAVALRLSRPAAGIRLHTAVELDRLPATRMALRDGVLDLPKVRAVVDAVSVLDDPTASAVEARVLPRAERQTVGQLRASLARAVLAADPAAAEERHERAVTGREVTVRPLPDGMAELWALLPADSAAAVYSRLDRLARSAPAGDRRGMDARRADALVATVLADPARPPAVVSTHDVTGAAGSAVGAVPPVAPVSGGSAACDRAGSAAAGCGTEARPVLPADAGPLAGSAAPGGSAAAGGRGVRSGGPAPTASVHVTVPAATALGIGDEPGELAGHGPVPASMARRLASTGVWRKVTTDPATGAVVEVGRTAYPPPAALADLVRARDRTCRFPGCRQPARRCDLDHVVPWPEGPTEAVNLAALCRHHHRLKHQTQWTVRAGPGGDLLWTTPTGHGHRTSPPPA